ncbi:MAG TPA: alpha/beta hydrolase [Alphaproteobacteria bacterium]|nr:alpha/beta hydrolase [Alphaproteobacteria bacterium]
MWALPPVRKGVEPDAALMQRRAEAVEFQKSQPVAPDVSIGEAPFGGVRCLVCEPPVRRATILYLHGGGFRLGSARGWTGFASRLAVTAEARIVVVDYRLAPEWPFPAALHDAASVYQALVEENAGPLFVGGDSAGGGLAASLAVACRNQAQMPRGLILLSPWLDLTLRSETWSSRGATDRFFPREAAKVAAEGYLQGYPADEPLVSPLLADLAGLPPVLLFAGEAEALLGDATAFAERLASAHVTVEAHLVAAMQHVWPVLFADLPETQAALEAMAAFVRRF